MVKSRFVLVGVAVTAVLVVAMSSFVLGTFPDGGEGAHWDKLSNVFLFVLVFEAREAVLFFWGANMCFRSACCGGWVAFDLSAQYE